MRGQLEATERERAELQRRLAQASGQQAGMAGQLLGSDLRKQLDMVHQQLAFKDQEVRDLQARTI